MRPILRSNVLRWMAANTILLPRTQQIAAAFGTDQHAIGKPASSEVISYKQQNYMRKQP